VRPRVFGVGLSKTGTTSLCKMLRMLGWKNVGHYVLEASTYDEYDAIADLPVATRYHMLDLRFPGSRFVLTTRNVESWLRSCERWVNKRPSRPGQMSDIRLETYGTTTFDEHMFREAYLRHEKCVKDYMRGHAPDRFVEIPLCDHYTCDEDKWFALCNLVGVPTPPRGTPVPWENPSWKDI